MPENQTPQPNIRVSEYAKSSSLTADLHNRPQNTAMPKWVIWAIAIAAAVIVLAALGLFIRSQQQLKSAKKELEQVQNDPAAKLKESNKELVDQVGKLIILPQDEQPTIATVSDLSKLQGQAFFSKAELGDKVLIYQLAKKAILFRPTDNKIIELAPLNNSTPSTTPTAPALAPTP
jgi:hypothetical protein